VNNINTQTIPLTEKQLYDREFHKRYYCRPGVQERYKARNAKNTELRRKKKAEFLEINKERLAQQKKEKRSVSNKKYEKKNKELIKQKRKVRREQNKQKIKDDWKIYYLKNKEKIREKNKEYVKKRRKQDPYYKLVNIIRNRIRVSLKYCKGIKSAKTMELLGCSIQEAREHIESQWLPGMSWDNHGSYGWHIDHIKPVHAFDLRNPEHQKICFHYTNLRPLWATDNLERPRKMSFVNGDLVY
jgi:hypothetical protein